MHEDINYRTYKISINFFFYSFYGDSKVFEIKKGESTILPGLKYSILTILFGWWSTHFNWYKNISNSFKALHINFNGGNNHNKFLQEINYEDRIVHIYNNLTKETKAKILIEDLQIIDDIQNEFLKTNEERFTQNNIQYLNYQLSNINLNIMSDNEIEDVFDAYRINERSQSKTGYNTSDRCTTSLKK